MTTRQFLSILLSCILFAHPLTLGQWGGTGMIFGSLYYKVRCSRRSLSLLVDFFPFACMNNVCVVEM